MTYLFLCVFRFPCLPGSREFAELLETAYAIRHPGLPITQMAVFLEQHASEGAHTHFHATVKAERVHRWSPIVTYLRGRGVYVHASKTHPLYYSCFRYCTMPSANKPRSEIDSSQWFSDGHPPVHEACRIPATAQATAALA